MTLTASDVASLKSALGCWEWAGYISTGVVFIGCVGEFFAEFTRFPAEEKKKRKLARLSLILVIAGIAGELLSTVRASQLSGLVIANVEAQAGDAKTSAEGAADAASRAKSFAQQAEGYATKANEKVDSFRLQIAQANERAAKAEKATEDERLARVKIEEKLAPRHLTLEQQQVIARQLRRSPSQQVSIWSYGEDLEIKGFTEDIVNIFTPTEGSGWVLVGRFTGKDPHGRTIAGVLIETRKGADERTLAAARLLVSALRNERVVVSGPDERNDNGGSFIGIVGSGAISAPITITIGKKP
jgi:hypothetical protein